MKTAYKKLDNKGFTLIELIVGMIVAGILTLTITTILAPTLKAFTLAKDMAEYNILLDMIEEQFRNDIKAATSFTVYVETDKPVVLQISKSQYDVSYKMNIVTPPADETEHNKLYKSFEKIPTTASTEEAKTAYDESFAPAFPPQYYKNKSIVASFEIPIAPAPNRINITLSLKDKDQNELISRTFTVKPLA